MGIALCLGLVLGAAVCVAAGWVMRGLRAPKPIPCEHQWDVRVGVVQRALNLSETKLFYVDKAVRERILVGQTTVLLTCACGELVERVIPGDAPSIAPQQAGSAYDTPASRVVTLTKKPRGSV